MCTYKINKQTENENEIKTISPNNKQRKMRRLRNRNNRNNFV